MDQANSIPLKILLWASSNHFAYGPVTQNTVMQSHNPHFFHILQRKMFARDDTTQNQNPPVKWAWKEDVPQLMDQYKTMLALQSSGLLEWRKAKRQEGKERGNTNLSHYVHCTLKPHAPYIVWPPTTATHTKILRKITTAIIYILHRFSPHTSSSFHIYGAELTER